MPHNYMLAKQINEERLREAEKARRFSHFKQTNGLSSILKSLLSLLARF